MKQVVNLGYAVNNGESGKDYAICVKETAGNSGNNCPQILELSRFEPGNTSGNTPVTTDNNNPEMLTEQAAKIGNNISKSLDEISVATKHRLHSGSNDNFVGTSSVTLLPEVTSFVTDPDAASGKSFTGICYPVTDAKLKVDDRAVLMGEGNSRPSEEVKAIWTVKTIQEQKVVVEYEPLGRRVFPLAWLIRYE